MQSIQLYLQPDQRLLQAVITRRGWQNKIEEFANFKEDSSKISNKYSIMAVADGVTQDVRTGENYPIPSGASKAAKIFCEIAINEAEKNYDNFSKETIINIFETANNEIEQLNIKNNINAENIDYIYHDYFSCAAAFALIKDSKLFWGTIIDCRIAVLSNKGELKFFSNEDWEIFNKNLPLEYENLNSEDRVVYQHQQRNKINTDGSLGGYGVLSGEANAMNYVNCGVIDLEDGDTVIATSDGFSPNLENEEFRKLILEFNEEDLIEFSNTYISENSRSGDNTKFLYDNASERALVAIKSNY